jgi:hypothetical protein
MKMVMFAILDKAKSVTENIRGLGSFHTLRTYP